MSHIAVRFANSYIQPSGKLQKDKYLRIFILCLIPIVLISSGLLLLYLKISGWSMILGIPLVVLGSLFLIYAYDEILAKFLAVFFILLLFSGGGIVIAADSAVPGDLLYPIDLWHETVRVVFEPDQQKQVEVYIDFAEERLQEAEKVIEKEDHEQFFNLLYKNQTQLQIAEMMIQPSFSVQERNMLRVRILEVKKLRNELLFRNRGLEIFGGTKIDDLLIEDKYDNAKSENNVYFDNQGLDGAENQTQNTNVIKSEEAENIKDAEEAEPTLPTKKKSVTVTN